MKRLAAGALLLALLTSLLCACGKDVQEESGGEGFATYRLPTEWTVTEADGRTRTYAAAYEGSAVTVTREGETVLEFTLDEAGNEVHRKEPDGSELTAVYGEDGRLTETILRDAEGRALLRTVYDADGRAVREYARGHYNEVSLRVMTYGEDGELLTETRYDSYGKHFYEYHENGERAVERIYLMDVFLTSCIEYDEEGRIAQEYDYDEDGTLSFRYEYDEEGNIAAIYDGEGNLYEGGDQEERIYDENGNLTEHRFYASDGSLDGWTEYDYDGAGNCVATRHYRGDGMLTQDTAMTYDGTGVEVKTLQRFYDLYTGVQTRIYETEWNPQGFPVREISYSVEGAILSDKVMTYETIGGKTVMVRALSYDEEGTLLLRQEMTYDENGNNTCSSDYDGEGTLMIRTTLTYDERGNLTEKSIRGAEDKLLHRTEMRYDEENNLLEQSTYDEDGNRTTHIRFENAYEYDDAGRPVSESRAGLCDFYTYAYKDGSGLRSETCSNENGEVLRTCETVYDSKNNPRIEKRTEWGYEKRFEYEWSEDGGLRSRVRYSGDKEVIARLETGSCTDCTLTEAQYRRILELLFELADRPDIDSVSKSYAF